MLISRLWKVDDESVYYKSDLVEVRQQYYAGLVDGTMTGYATDGTVMDADEASQAFLLMCDYMQEPLTTTEQIYRNITLVPTILAAVRTELVNVPDGYVYYARLDDIIKVMQSGGFDTAGDMLLAMIPDDVITTAQLERWADMLHTADAIVVG